MTFGRSSSVSVKRSYRKTKVRTSANVGLRQSRWRELGTTEVVPGLVQVISSDPRPDLRPRAISMLLHLARGDGAARMALEAAAANDPDPLTRRAAVGALRGHFVAPRTCYERRQRTHAGTARHIGP